MAVPDRTAAPNGVTVYPGAVWSFTVSAKLASLPVPVDGAILVDPNATLSWTPGSGAVSHSVLTQEEMITAMRGNPLLAWNPRPAMGHVVDIQYSEPLSWSAGDGAAQHDLYFGIDKAAVQAATTETAGVYQGRQAETTYGLAEPLAWDTTYYWRVDEVGDDGTITPGNVWSFTVADYLIVDDFESYTDDLEAQEAIYQTWIDGYESLDNGSQVGYTEGPFAEQVIVHGGRQSMPLHYTNMGVVAYSEAQRKWGTLQDWTVHGLGRLVLHIRGRAENNPVRLYVTITDRAGQSATVANTDTDVVLAADWLQWSIPFSALASVDLTEVDTFMIGLGDRANPVSGMGLIYIDDIQARTAQE